MSPFLAQAFYIPRNCLSCEGDQAVFCHANDVSFKKSGSPKGRGWLPEETTQLKESHPWLQGGRGLEVESSSMVNDFINHDCVIKSFWNPKRMGFRGLQSWWTCGDLGREVGSDWGSSTPLPYLTLCTASFWLFLSCVCTYLLSCVWLFAAPWTV